MSDSSKSLARELTQAVFGSVGVRMAGMVMTFVVGVQLARYLGPTDYGIYGTVWALVLICAVPVQFGLPQLLTREASAHMATGNIGRVRGAIEVFGRMILRNALGLCFLAAVSIGILVSAGALSRELGIAYAWGFAAMPLIALLNFAVGGVRGFNGVVAAQVFDGLLRPTLFAAFLLIGWLLIADMSASLALALQAIALLIALVCCFWYWRRQAPSSVLASAPEHHKSEWWSSARPMAGSEVLRVVDSQYGVLLLGFLAPLDQVGLFRVALGLVAFVLLPNTLINVVVMPYLARFWANGEHERLQKLVATAAVALFLAPLIISAVLYLVGNPILTFVFGPAFADSWAPLMIMSLAYVVGGFFGLSIMTTNMCGQEKAVTRGFVIGLTVSGLTALALYPIAGILCVPIAMIFAELCRGLYLWYIARTRLAIDTSVLGAISWVRK